LVVNGTWEVPTAKSFGGPARWATDGWELGLILTVSDGVPLTPTWGTGSDPANTLSGDDFAFPNRLGGPGCRSLVNPGNPNNYIKTQCLVVPAAPDQNFWNANCDPAPPSLGATIASTPNLDPLACFNLRGNAGRNSLIGPGITNLDFSVFKNNRMRRISENFNVQFRMEIFNILNRSEEHTSELQSPCNLVCRLLLEKKNKKKKIKHEHKDMIKNNEPHKVKLIDSINEPINHATRRLMKKNQNEGNRLCFCFKSICMH